MKLILSALVALILTTTLILPAKAQQDETLTALDNNWKRTSSKSAPYLLRVLAVNDTCWQYDYYHFSGPLVRTEQYRDKRGKLLHGVTRYYDAEGNLDSTGMYQNGKMHGEFYKLLPNSDSPHYRFKYKYENDQLVETIDLQQKRDTTTTSYPDEKEAEYPGGLSRWGHFLTKNLRYPERAIKAKVQGTVWVGFMVNTEGHTNDPYIFKSVEYSLDAESIRMIRASGKWKPAFQDGKKVKSYKLQPIIYRFE